MYQICGQIIWCQNERQSRYVNSVSAMKMDKMKRSIFVEIHYFREAYAAFMVNPYFVRSSDNRSDGLTKAIGTHLHSALFQKILFSAKYRS
jgi:hypothetical protein